jgi:hypothetical protein
MSSIVHTRRLRVRFMLALRDHAPGSDAERKEQAQLDSEDRGYKAALLTTLARTRQLVQEGEI